MSNIVNYNEQTFEFIKHINENGQEFWYARELQKTLEYSEWRNFQNVINKAKDACKNSGNNVQDHFADVNKMVGIDSNASRPVDDIELSRYACYLLVMNGDSTKKVIALGQIYFAVKTRQQELIENYKSLDEDQKRLAIRNEMKIHNKSLADAAKNAGIEDSKDYAIFQNRGYQGKEEAGDAHYEVGKKVRQTIAELGGTMPEDLPTPIKSIKQIEKEEAKRIEQSQSGGEGN